MDNRMRSRFVRPLTLLVILLMVPIVNITAVRATPAIVNSFFADCNRFSVNVTVRGVTNDSNGFDKFRYMVVDGSGKTLYTEDSTRQTGIADSAAALDLSYDPFALMSGGPAQNPIHFYVIDLDSSSRPGAILQELTYNAACLLPSSAANAPVNFLSLVRAEAATTRSTSLYYAPSMAAATTANITQGSTLSVVYQSLDGNWVSVLVSPKDMLWIPSSTINVPLHTLPVQPIRIDLSQTVTGAVSPGGVPVGTGRARFTVRMRALPTTASAVLTTIRWQSTLLVLGTNASRTWYAVIYKGVAGWVSAPYVQLLDVTRAALPVLQ